jgi:hypothetical protein
MFLFIGTVSEYNKYAKFISRGGIFYGRVWRKNQEAKRRKGNDTADDGG